MYMLNPVDVFSPPQDVFTPAEVAATLMVPVRLDDISPQMISKHASNPLSEIFGTMYTTIWAIAWYPQIIANYKEKSSVGYCYDLVVYNIYGFCLYTVYTISQYQYQEVFQLEDAVEWQDIFFAIHSLLINIFYMSQAWYYDGRPSFSQVGWFCKRFVYVTMTFILLQVGLATFGYVAWVSVPGAVGLNGVAESDWSVAECMGLVKALITVTKYPSQIVLNYDRKSTQGMSTLGFALDLLGGVCALAQNLSESIMFNDFTYLTANLPKLIVALSSAMWDCILIYQGFYLYRNQAPIPIEERVSHRKPETKTAKILELFAPAPWPPADTEEDLCISGIDNDPKPIGKSGLYDASTTPPFNFEIGSLPQINYDIGDIEQSPISDIILN